MYNKELQDELIHQPEADVSLMTNRQLEEKIVKQFKKIKIVIKKKIKIIMHKNSNLLEQEDLKKLKENNLIDKVAFILRSTILKMDKTTLPAAMKMEDLINGEYTIPEKLDRFFKALIGGKDIRHRDGFNCHRVSNSLASDAIYCVSNGTVKSSKHITLGVFINECGLSHMRIESNIIASGSVNGLVEGKHFNRCIRLHPLMALVLKMLHFDHFLKMDNIEYNFLKEQVIDDLLHYQENIDSHSSMPIELPNNVLSRVLSAYQKFVEETRQDNLNKVDETHPGLKNDFMNGCFGIKRTDKPFSSIPIDLTLERLSILKRLDA
ncbi:uncharacterized protein TNCV_3766451 [Trichonephila clavipes]|nr:uncharacterized protein TNCV_3766451 [Trichonephila clavipes]